MQYKKQKHMFPFIFPYFATFFHVFLWTFPTSGHPLRAELRRLEPSEESAARLSHICAASDFLSADYQGVEQQGEVGKRRDGGKMLSTSISFYHLLLYIF
jgi:hypothetical protein